MKSLDDGEDQEYLLRNRFGPIEFDKEKTKELARLISDYRNTVVFFSSKSFEGNKTLNQKEKWYGFSYGSTKYSAKLKSALACPVISKSDLKLGLPPRNTLLPKSFKIAASMNTIQIP